MSATDTTANRNITAEIALQRERDLLQAVMNGARNVHLVYLDRDFNFVRVNEAYAATCGYRPEEMIGKNHFDLYPNPEIEAIFARVRDTGEVFEAHDKPFEFPDQPERGITYWDWTLTPVKDAAGTVEGLVFSLHETTGRKRAEEAVMAAECEKTLILDSANEIIAYHDTENNLIWANKAYLDSLGMPLSELKGKRCYHCWGLDRFCRDCPVIAAIRTGQPQEGELTPENQPDWPAEQGCWSVRAAPVKDGTGTVIGAIETAYNITDRKRAEEELRTRNAELAEFNELMVGRELRMIELKKEINELCRQAGRPERYDVSEEPE